MNRPVKLVTEAMQTFSFSRRAMALGGLQAVGGMVLAGRMGWLAIAENEHYQTLAESNRVSITMIPPRRGWIVDRHGAPIANNRTDFRVDIIPDRLEDKDKVLGLLRQILSLSDDEVDRINVDLKRAGGFQPVQVAENLDWEHFAAVSVRLPELTGVTPTRGFARNYPKGAAVAHLTGYVGTASVEQYKAEKNPLLVTPGFKLGKDGLEKVMEKRLRGVPGQKRVEVTARGKLVRELATRKDVQGETVRLTIDLGLQDFAARRMGPSSGSVVVMDVLTGDLLAMVSVPAYDPNSFSEGIGRLEWKMLSEDDHIPLMNKVLQGLYPPGSTVKPMHGLALLQNGINPAQTVHCSGVLQVGNGRFHCHKRGGHGAVNMNTAIAQSCDIYFYQMSRELGYDRFAPTAREMGLGALYQLPFVSQRYGTVPDSAWKLKKYKQPWTVADSINASIGQGYVLVNPLQLAVMAGRIAGGRNIVPRILADHRHGAAPELPIDPEKLDVIRHGMWTVVNGGGTGGAARLYLDGIEVAAKTGTAQVRRITAGERASGVLKNAALPFKLRDHALFVAFAPVSNPRYAMSIVSEHHGHVDLTTDPPRVAKDIFTYLFDRDKAMASLASFEEGWGGDIATRMAAQSSAYTAAQQVARLPVPPEDVESATSNVVANAQTGTPAGAIDAAQADEPERDP